MIKLKIDAYFWISLGLALISSPYLATAPARITGWINLPFISFFAVLYFFTILKKFNKYFHDNPNI